MFFQEISEIKNIASKVHCTIFVVPKNTEVEIKNALILEPKEKTTITIEQVHNVMDSLKTRQHDDVFVVIRPAELLTDVAANAILKSLEEPQEKVHFVLISDSLSRLLPTILSRAEIYVWRGGITKISEIKADEKVKTLAKKMLVAKPNELVDLAEEICKKKDGVRGFALSVLEVAVEMAYKSYFITGKTAFLSKIPKLISAYEGISANGHTKLHLVADLI